MKSSLQGEINSAQVSELKWDSGTERVKGGRKRHFEFHTNNKLLYVSPNFKGTDISFYPLTHLS